MNSKILLKDHMSFYKNISSTNSKVAGSGAIPSSVVHGDNYDQDSVSIGEDNVGQIVMALESFKKLHDEYNSNYKGGLLLIDEVDAALFPAAQKRLIDVLKEYSETYNIQIVMTSHSPTMIQYLEKLGPNAGKIIPLFYEQGILKTGDKKFSEIESDLLAQLPINSSIKIRCYLEDSEASELFKAILNENDTGKRILNKKIEIMDVSMGSKNYIHLIDKGVPEFKDLSLVILDGDESSDNSTIIKLPFCVPPDQLLFEFLFILNNDDPFWAEINTSKQVFFNDFGKPVIQYFELNSQMNLLSLREKIQLKKGPERDRDLEDKAREIFKKFYKHSFIQGLLESENTNPFNELIKRKFDADQQSLSDFITKINDEIKNEGEEEFETFDELASYIYEDEDYNAFDFDFEKELKEETLKLTFGETFIKIPCIEAKNNFLEVRVNLKKNKIKYIPICKLLEIANNKRKLDSKEVEEILERKDEKLRKGAKKPSPISRTFNEVKSGIREINELIKSEMKRNDILEEDFILLNSQKGNYSIFISDKFQW